MRRVRLGECRPARDASDPEGFRAAMDRLGPRLGARTSGATFYEVPPGQAVCPYHYEHGEEEWALVLEGRPSVRTPAGVERLAPLDLVFFPAGPDGAHQIRNDDGAPARVLMWSTVVWPAVTEYPDSGKVGVYLEGDAPNLVVERSSGVDYYRGEAPPED